MSSSSNSSLSLHTSSPVIEIPYHTLFYGNRQYSMHNTIRYYSYQVPSPCHLYQKKIVLDQYMEGFHEIRHKEILKVMGVIHLIHLQRPALMLIVPLLKTRYHHHYNRVFYEPCTSCRIQSCYNKDSFFDLVEDAWWWLHGLQGSLPGVRMRIVGTMRLYQCHVHNM